MEPYEKILVLNNEFEADVMEEILTDQNIPHGIVPRPDSVLEGIVQMESGWGYVEAPPVYKDEIIRLYEEMNQETKDES